MNLFKNRTVIGIICILLSLLICFGVTPLFNKTVSQKTEIVRVMKEIKAGDEITKKMTPVRIMSCERIDRTAPGHSMALTYRISLQTYRFGTAKTMIEDIITGLEE